MITVWDGNKTAGVYYDAGETLCIRKALQDLKKDLASAGMKDIRLTDRLPEDAAGALLIGTLKNKNFTEYLESKGIGLPELEGKWEHYTIRTMGAEKDTLLIAGSDDRGTMWGIYTFSERFLGIDPLYLWTDQVPKPVERLMLEELCITDGPEHFRFRGWFVNDEDLIEGFSKGGKPYPGYDFHRDYTKVLEMLVETGLRLKQNLLIPCSHLDICNPDEEELVRIVTERGMYISMHHQEPVGVHQFTMDRYWKERGITDINYFSYREEYEQVWRRYIRKWSRYQNVIWQLGLRGRGDRPVWYQENGVPDSLEERGKLISDAIRRQYEIVKEENPGREVLCSSTLWMEGMELYGKGALTFPQDTIVVFADFAPEQMLGEDYFDTPREAGRQYGLYYHVAFWGCGPHLVQGNPSEKIDYIYRNLVAHGDCDYSVLNVANFREHVYNIRYVAELTWNIERFQPDSYCAEWCRQEFHTEDPAPLQEIYREYYQCFYEMSDEKISGQMLFMDGMTRRVAMKLMELIQGKPFTQADIQNKRLFDFQNAKDFIAYYKKASGEGHSRFTQLHRKAAVTLGKIAKERRQFFISHMVVQIETMIGLYGWVYALSCAAEDRMGERDGQKYEGYIDDAVYALSRLCIDRKKALTGKWEHWYDNDALMNLEEALGITERLHLGLPAGLSYMKARDSR
nr:glycosyl hydrolase 115 family protein [uncultured Acetatifactor sp.]